MSRQKKYRVREDKGFADCWGLPWAVEYRGFWNEWKPCLKWCPDPQIGNCYPVSFKTEEEAILYAKKMKSLNRTYEPEPKSTGKIIAIQ